MRRATNTPKACPHNDAVSCSSCRLSGICLPLALESAEIVKLDNIVRRGRPLPKGRHIFREGDDFTSVFVLRSGAVKTYTISDIGEEQVTGFYFPGEVVGLDGIGRNRYASSAVALEVSAICEIPFAQIEYLSSQLPNLQHHFFRLLSSEIIDDQSHFSLLSKHTAEERLAALLVSISARQARRRLSPSAFLLPMSRTDIASFLGLTAETVSRVFSRFSQLKLLCIDNKEVSSLDICGLKAIANLTH